MATKKTSKQTIQFWFALALVVFGVALITAAFCAPPLGEIHPSVLGAFGELLTFSGAILGIDYKYKMKEYETNQQNRNSLHSDESDAESDC